MPDSASTMKTVPFVAFLSANAISMVGDSFRAVTLMLWVYDDSTGRVGPALAALMIAQLLPSVMTGLFAGVLVDRFPGRRLLLLSDLLRGVVGLGLVYCALQGAILSSLAFVVISSGLGVFSSIAGAAMMPQLVSDKELDKANGLWSILEQLSFIVGPATAAVCYAKFGASLAFGIDAASFFLSFAALAAFLPSGIGRNRERGGDRVASEASSTSPFVVMLRDVAEGLAYLRHNGLSALAIGAAAFRAISAGLNNTTTIIFISQVLSRQPTDIAWLATCNGIVQVFVGASLIALSGRLRLAQSLRLGAAAMVIGGTLVALSQNLVLLIAGVVITSIGNSPANIGHNTLIQRFVPVGMLGRVRGFEEVVVPLSFIIGSAAAGALVGVVGARSVLGISAVSLALAMVLTEFAARRMTGDARSASEDRIDESALPDPKPDAHTGT